MSSHSPTRQSPRALSQNPNGHSHSSLHAHQSRTLESQCPFLPLTHTATDRASRREHSTRARFEVEDSKLLRGASVASVARSRPRAYAVARELFAEVTIAKGNVQRQTPRRAARDADPDISNSPPPTPSVPPPLFLGADWLLDRRDPRRARAGRACRNGEADACALAFSGAGATIPIRAHWF